MIGKYLAEQGLRYQELFEKMSEALVLHEVIYDQDGLPSDFRFIAVNPMFEELVGLSAASVIGRTLREVLPDMDSYWLQQFGEVALTGKALSVIRYCNEFQKYVSVHVFSPSPGRLAVLFRDVTENKRAEERIRHQNEYLRSMYDTSLALMNHRDVMELLEEIVIRAEALVGANGGFVFLANQKQKMELKIGKGIYTRLAGLKIQPGEGLAGQVWVSGKATAIADVEHWSGKVPDVDYGGIDAIVAVPLWSETQITGIIGLAHSGIHKQFTDEDLQVLAQFAQLASIALDNARLYSAVRQELAERKLAEERLQLALEAFKNTVEGVVIIDPAWTILWVNRAFCDISGYPEAEIVGAPIRNIYHEELAQQIRAHMETDGKWNGEVWAKRRGGGEYPAWCTLRAVYDDAAVLRNYILVCHDISERKRDRARIHYLANYDSLTGLRNRSLCLEHLKLSLNRVKRDKKLAVLFIDLDHFKLINDAYGHAVGDDILKIAAARLRACVKEEGLAARMGGDEFTLIIPDIYQIETAVNMAQKIMAGFAAGWQVRSECFHITASIGIAICPDDGAEAQELLRHAELAMYLAKEQGKNNYQFFEPELNRLACLRLSLENNLRHALANQELTVYYQPKVDIKSGAIVGVEALIRWRHPERGMISPGEFIPLAEETGLIVPIGEWVLKTACEQSKRWQAQGLQPIRISVNLSARQFQQKNFSQRIVDILNGADFDPAMLELEITESTAVRDTGYTIRTLKEFEQAGIRISLDDFGTGYSSFTYLKQFSIHTLKIDQSFIRDLEQDDEDAAIVATMIGLAHNLRMRVIAEGVERTEQLSFLAQHDCDEMQGFLFSRPVPPEEIAVLLQNQQK